MRRILFLTVQLNILMKGIFKLDNVQKTSPGEVIIYLRVLMTWANGQQQLATHVRSSMLPSKCY